MLDISTVRDRWPDVLDSIREVRKVAWILLSNATVESVEGNVLVLGFAKEGDAKGFGGSGCDQDLAGVLDAMFGVRPIIRPVVAPSQGRSAANEASQQRRDRPRAEAARAELPGPDDRPAASSVRPDSTPAEDAGRDSTRSPRQPKRPGRPAADAGRDFDPAMHDDPRPLTDPDQPGSADDLTGSDLVLRELGGTVIEETGDE